MNLPIKILISATLLISFLSALIPEIRDLFALSWWGIHHFFLWQFITYIFAETGPISFNFFLSLGFHSYLLWMFGSSLIERIGTKMFLALYFSSAVTGSLIILLWPHFILAGSTNAVYALLIAWMFLNPNSQLLLFFTLPFKSYLLILTLIGISIVLKLTSGNEDEGLCLLISCIYSYFFSIFSWKQTSPIDFLNPFEKKILKILEKKTHRFYHSSKIYDIKSGEPILDDEQFMDAMLDRISRHGEGSLTKAERRRMKKISKNHSKSFE